jgi:enoyl-CoA hydratase/carnithine racemase
MILRAKKISGPEALRIGLVSEVWPLAELFERALVLVPYSQLARDNLARVLAHEQPALTSEGP